MKKLFKAISALLGWKGTPDSSSFDPDSALIQLMQYTAQKEGGLAYGELAGDKKLVRAPCGENEDGIFPHTSRGVTWSTYMSYCTAKSKGIDCQEWLDFSSPDNSTGNNPVWKDVLLWVTRKGKEYSNEEIVAYLAGLWYWGGWIQELTPRSQLEAVINNSNTVKSKAMSIIALRLKYFDKMKGLGGTYVTTADRWIKTWNKYKEIVSTT